MQLTTFDASTEAGATAFTAARNPDHIEWIIDNVNEVLEVIMAAIVMRNLDFVYMAGPLLCLLSCFAPAARFEFCHDSLASSRLQVLCIPRSNSICMHILQTKLHDRFILGVGSLPS